MLGEKLVKREAAKSLLARYVTTIPTASLIGTCSGLQERTGVIGWLLYGRDWLLGRVGAGTKNWFRTVRCMFNLYTQSCLVVSVMFGCLVVGLV